MRQASKLPVMKFSSSSHGCKDMKGCRFPKEDNWIMVATTINYYLNAIIKISTKSDE